MADPPPPQTCTARGCHYNTPVGAPTWDVVLGLMNAHVQAAHPNPVQAPVQAGAGGAAVAGGGAAVMGKLDKRPRPQATTDMTEHEFKFFENEWQLYVRATQVQGQALVDELYSTMSPELRKLVANILPEMM